MSFVLPLIALGFGFAMGVVFAARLLPTRMPGKPSAYRRHEALSIAEGCPVWVRPGNPEDWPLTLKYVPITCPECGKERPRERMCCNALLMSERGAENLLGYHVYAGHLDPVMP